MSSSFHWPAKRLQEALKGYEPRPQQSEMAAAVATAAAEGNILLAEAGTGVGKTLAYLIPGIHNALSSGAPLIVATSTINLQNQIMEKDLPFLERSIFPGLSYELLMGRSNYLCLEEMHDALGGGDGDTLFGVDPASAAAKRLSEWAEETTTGRKGDLPFTVPFWPDVNCDTPICQGSGCPEYERCFYYLPRRRLDKAQVIVTNHAFLLRAVEFSRKGSTHTATFREGALPKPSMLVIDEAHTLEAAAQDALTAKSGSASISHHLDRLISSRDPTKGLLPLVQRRLSTSALKPAVEALNVRVHKARKEIKAIVKALDTTTHPTLFPFRLGRPRAASGEATEAATQAAAASLAALAESLASGLSPIHKEVSARAKAASATDKPRWERLASRLRATLALGDHAALLHAMSSTLPAARSVAWVSRRHHSRTTRYEWQEVPLEVSGPLSALWGAVPAAVLSSATLAVNGSMTPLARRLGAPAARTQSVLVGSPFNYRENCRHIIVRGIGPYEPPPGNPAHAERLAPTIIAAVSAAKGRTLVLFTSHHLLNLTKDLISPSLNAANIQVLAQGKEGRTQITRRFQTHQPSVLLGTDSFWQGVDLPGPTLSLLIITRLPFRNPKDPLQEARQEAYEEANRDYFREASIPEAILRFRQGFGRLIRTQTDQGVVLTLDDRLLTKHYGQGFLDSLPAGLEVVTASPEMAGEFVRLGLS